MAYQNQPANFSKDDIPSIYIPPISKEEFISTAKLAATATLYGLGVSAAIARLKIPPNQTEYDTVTGYNPDAKIGASGQYERTSRWDGYLASSLIGMPVMSYIKFIGGTYIDLQGNTQTIPDVLLENVILSLTMNKNIEETTISGRDTGEVAEYIGLLNWDIEIRAVITADAPVNDNITRVLQDGVYPRDNMSAIFNVLKAPIALPVSSWYLQQFDINYLTVRSSSIQQVEGEYSTQRIVINCKSDNPLIIKVGA